MASRPKYWHISTAGASFWYADMISRFIVHQHKAGKPHYDLRFVQNDMLRSWSLLKEPPLRQGEIRLAIERASFSAQAINSSRFKEEAFGEGNVHTWDEGEANVAAASARHMIVAFMGRKLSGKYEFRRMRWYPGNRWLLRKAES